MKPVLRLLSPSGSVATAFLMLGFGCGGAPLESQAWAASTPVASAGPLSLLIHTNYHGWTNAILVSNGHAEAIIVPEIGRVMQFRLAGAEQGPFWENPTLRGGQVDPASTNWSNFGGDRTWPAPQADWNRVTGRLQPPPVGFDGRPYDSSVDGWVVTLTSSIDPHYGMRVRRTIELTPGAPAMVIHTVFEKIQGDAVELGIWVLTQLQDPVALATPLLADSRFREGYKVIFGEVPPSLKTGNGILSLKRNPEKTHKIGTDTGTLFWIGDDSVLRIDSPRIPYKAYPDDGCSAQILTGADTEGHYVELATLGPLRKLLPGQRLERVSTYTLLPRAELDPRLEAQMLWAASAPRAPRF